MIKPLYLLVCVAFVVSSCYFENKIHRQGAVDSRDPRLECFIEMMDGTIVPYNSLKIKSPPLQYQYLQGNGERLTINTKDIRAFQTEKFYAYKLYDKSPGVIGKLPFSELFAERIVNGKIELFVIREMNNSAYGPNSSGYQKSYFIRKGKTNDLVPATRGSLKKMISDNKSLAADFESLYKGTYPFKSIMRILEEYN